MNEAKELTARLNGKWFERRGYGTAKCPAHDDNDPSLLIGTFENGKLRLKCLAGCAGHAVFAALPKGGLPQGVRANADADTRNAAPATDDDYRRIAARVWRGARERIEDTPVAAYLAGRNVRQPPAGSEVMRYDPACWNTETNSRLPAMICRITDFRTGVPMGIHRTYLRPDGSGKADVKDAKLTLGPMSGGVIRLVHDTDITVRLNLAEGVETALSCIKNGWPTWSAISAYNLGNLPVLPGTPDLGIFADRDESGTGQREAKKLADRWSAAGGWAEIFTPDIIGDWNDLEARQ